MTKTTIISKNKSNVDTPSLSYKSMQDDWDLVNSLMGGTASMRSAGVAYLPKEPKESDLAYKNRLNRSVLFNAFSNTVRKLVGKPFSKPIVVSDVEEEVLNTLIYDIDKNGNDITNFAREVFESALIDGLTYVLVDYPAVPQKLSIADEKQNKIRPYCVHIRAKDLISWKSENINGIETLKQIRIRESVVVSDGDWGEKVVNRIRVYEPDKYQLYEQKSKNKWEKVEEGVISLNKIPLVTFYTNKTNFMEAKPPLLDLAYLNLQHWQSSSDQEHILHFIRFPLLHATGFEDNDEPVEIGPNRMIRSSDAQARLTYVEHTGAAVEAGRQSIKDTEERMETLGLQLLIKKTGNTTATESALNSAKESCDLQMMVRNLENVFKNIIQLMFDWTNRKNEFKGSVDINQDFGISENANLSLDLLLSARTSNEISRKTFLGELKRRMIDDLDVDEELKLIEEELKSKEEALKSQDKKDNALNKIEEQETNINKNKKLKNDKN